MRRFASTLGQRRRRLNKTLFSFVLVDVDSRIGTSTNARAARDTQSSRHTVSDAITLASLSPPSQREREMRYESISFVQLPIPSPVSQSVGRWHSKKQKIYCVNISIYPCVHNQTNGIVHVTHSDSCELRHDAKNSGQSANAMAAAAGGNFFLSRQSFYILFS